MSATLSAPATRGLYGRSLGEKFGTTDAPSVVTRALWQGQVAVTDLRIDRPIGRLSDSLPRINSFMICLMLEDLPDNAYFEEGRQVSAYSLHAGDSTIHDLRRDPAAMMDKPLHSILFHLPNSILNELADQAGVSRISELRYEPGAPVADETIKHIGLSLMPAFRAPDQVSRLFTDYAMLAFASHAASTYGGMQLGAKLVKGGLAPWQERLSKDMIAGDLTDAKSLHEIARACGISVSHFSRAFRKSTGLAPHAWLLQERVESAKHLLRRRDLSLSEIARACGFADQSHFARVFSNRVGSSPGVWRKAILD